MALEPQKMLTDLAANGKKIIRLALDAVTALASEAEIGWDSTDKVPKWHTGTGEEKLTDVKLSRYQPGDANYDLAVSSITVGVDFTPTLGTHVVNKAFLDSQLVSIGQLKERLLDRSQLPDSATDGLRQATVFLLEGDLPATRAFQLKKTDVSTVTESFQAVASSPGAFQFEVGTSVNVTQQNIVDTINADSTIWGAAVVNNMNEINDGSGGRPANNSIIVIYRKIQLDGTDDRLYTDSIFATEAKMISYAGETDYIKSTLIALPSGDPGSKNFGFGRITADLITNELHSTRSNDELYAWDPDANKWQAQGSTVYTQGDGIVISSGTIAARLDPNKGLAFATGKLTILVDTVTTGQVVPALNQSSNGLGVKIDNSTVKVNGSNQLIVNKAIFGVKENFAIVGDGATTTFTFNYTNGQSDTRPGLWLMENSTGKIVSIADLKAPGATQARAEFSPAPNVGENYTLITVANGP